MLFKSKEVSSSQDRTSLIKRPNLMGIVTGVVLALVLTQGVAYGAKLITGKDIKDGSVGTNDIANNNLLGKDIKNGKVFSEDIHDGSLASGDIKNGTVKSGDLADGSVTADKLAPDAIATLSSLWSTLLRNQTGAAVSGVQAGPGGAGQLNDGSLRLATTANPDVAAFGNSLEFLGIRLDQITDVSYSTFNGAAAPSVRPSLRIEINPHLVDDATPGGGFEFTTLIHEAPPPAATGWVSFANALADDAWRLSGDEGTQIGCDQVTSCTFAEVVDALDASPDADTAPPAISSGIYFGLGNQAGAAETAVDEFVFNGLVFDFEPTGVFMTPAP
jgi:hypothetical protein